jgi:hypothetical protein
MPQAPFRPRAGRSLGGRTAKLTGRRCNELETQNRLLPPRSGKAPRSAGLWGGGTASRGRNGQRTVQGPLHVPPLQDAPDQPQRGIPEERPGLERVRPADSCPYRLATLREPPLPVGQLGQPAQWAGEAADSIAEPARPVLGWAKQAISAAATLVAEVRATTRSTPRRRRRPTRRYRRLRESA